MTEWRDISTAPKDGTLVLLWCASGIEPSLAKFVSGQWRNNYYGSREPHWYYSDPTHWHPLPAPPVSP